MNMLLRVKQWCHRSDDLCCSKCEVRFFQRMELMTLLFANCYALAGPAGWIINDDDNWIKYPCFAEVSVVARNTQWEWWLTTDTLCRSGIGGNWFITWGSTKSANVLPTGGKPFESNYLMATLLLIIFICLQSVRSMRGSLANAKIFYSEVNLHTRWSVAIN